MPFRAAFFARLRPRATPTLHCAEPDRRRAPPLAETDSGRQRAILRRFAQPRKKALRSLRSRPQGAEPHCSRPATDGVQVACADRPLRLKVPLRANGAAISL